MSELPGTQDGSATGAAVGTDAPVLVDHAPPTQKTPSGGLIFGIVVMAFFMATIDLTIVATAFPAIHKALHASLNWAGWTITIYGLGSAVVYPIAGKVGDQFGRKRIFTFGVALFTLSSVACGMSTDIYMLIVFRALQSIGGGSLLPLATGIVADHFGKNRDRAIGMIGTVSAMGQLAGPVLGGVLVGYFSWRWIFFVNVPIGSVLFVLVVRFIPGDSPRATSHIDLRGMMLFSLFVLGAILGITDLGEGHTALLAPDVVLPVLCAIAMGFLFLRHAKNTVSPIVSLELLRGKGFAALNAINFLFGCVSFGVAALVPLYAEQRYHLAPLGAGTLLTARALGSFAIGAFVTFGLRRTGYRLPIFAGLFFSTAGLVLLSISPLFGFSSYGWLCVSTGICGLGAGACSPPCRNAGMEGAPDQAASISGIRGMCLFSGVIFSVAVATAILNRSTDPALTQAHIYWALIGIIVFVMVPITLRIPEHKGNW